mmetsp:Transcript_123885/g.246563  ORF Transcript_123885/g.246563 Transcript_123885/m.246563 type:complete len:127 (-) Transcript_123885:1-381(-)
MRSPGRCASDPSAPAHVKPMVGLRLLPHHCACGGDVARCEAQKPRQKDVPRPTLDTGVSITAILKSAAIDTHVDSVAKRRARHQLVRCGRVTAMVIATEARFMRGTREVEEQRLGTKALPPFAVEA